MTPAPIAWLNPADIFTFVLDQEIRKSGMPGGYCGFALELASTPDLDLLRSRLALLAECFPLATARLVRRGKRWGWIATDRPLALEHLACPPGDDPEAFGRETVQEILNRPSSLDTTPPLSFHWLAGGQGGVLLLRWLHPLLDARGAKIVLDFLDSGAPERFPESTSLVLQKLSGWSLGRKIGYFLKAKRHNGRVNRLESCLPTRTETGAQTLRLRVRRYDPEESARISRLALGYMGLAGRTLYLLGCFMRAVESAGPPVAGAGYCIPYAFNLRRQSAPTPVFGNQVSCLFAQASREQARDREVLMAHLLAQNRGTVKDELDYAYLPLLWLGQWLSPERYATLLRKQPGGGELSSAWFSDVGEVRFGEGGFLGARVAGMYHLTWMTLPPGLALLAGQTDGRLTLSWNSLHPAVDEDWLERVMVIMDAELLGEGV